MPQTVRPQALMGPIELLGFIYQYTQNLTPRQKDVLVHMNCDT